MQCQKYSEHVQAQIISQALGNQHSAQTENLN